MSPDFAFTLQCLLIPHDLTLNLPKMSDMELKSRIACNIKLCANPHFAGKKTGLAWWRQIDEPMVSPGIRNTRINKGLPSSGTSKLDPAPAYTVSSASYRFIYMY